MDNRWKALANCGLGWSEGVNNAVKTKRKPGNRLYSSPEWLTVRQMVLVRDQYLCQLRGPRCLGAADRVDHYVPRSKGGSNHPSNLYAACNLCNSSKKDSLPEPVATVNW